MYHFLPPAKCSKCGSTHNEGVTYYNETFIRCRDCGHEGEHREIIPTTTASASYKIEEPAERTF